MRPASGVVIHGDDIPHKAVSVSEQRLDLGVGGKVGFEQGLGIKPDAFNAGEWLEALWEPSRLHTPVEHRPHAGGVLPHIQWGVALACESVLKGIKMRTLDGGGENIAVRLAPASEMTLALVVKPAGTMASKPIEIAVTQGRDRQRGRGQGWGVWLDLN